MNNTTTADFSEIHKFDARAHSWWDPEGAFKALHDINPLRCQFIDSKAQLAGKKILDVGCGGGLLAEAMTYRGAEVTAIDLAANSIAAAKVHARENHLNIDYQCTSVDALATATVSAFDVVTCLEMLEHVSDPEAIICACAKLTRPGGQLFFSTINRTSKAFLQAILGAEYLLKLLPRGTHSYEKFIKPSELAACFRNSKLELVSMIGLTYNPITQSYRLCPNVDVNYIVEVRKPLATSENV